LDIWLRMVTEPLAATAAVAELTGAEPRTYREWAIEHADDFRLASQGPLSAAV
jgi:hypothetical protein